MMPDIFKYHANLVSYLYLWIINIHFLSKSWNIKRVAGYLFCTERNVTRIIILSIISHVRWYQIFPDIRLNLVSYLYLLNINFHFLSKSWHIKRVAGYLFCTGRNVTCIIISSIMFHVRWYQILPDITLIIVSYLYLFIINILFLPKFWNIKRVAGYLFCTGSMLHILLYQASSVTSDDRYFQISRLIASVTCTFWSSRFIFCQNPGV